MANFPTRKRVHNLDSQIRQPVQLFSLCRICPPSPRPPINAGKSKPFFFLLGGKPASPRCVVVATPFVLYDSAAVDPSLGAGMAEDSPILAHVFTAILGEFPSIGNFRAWRGENRETIMNLRALHACNFALTARIKKIQFLESKF